MMSNAEADALVERMHLYEEDRERGRSPDGYDITIDEFTRAMNECPVTIMMAVLRYERKAAESTR